MGREFLPRTEPYHQTKLYAKCLSFDDSGPDRKNLTVPKLLNSSVYTVDTMYINIQQHFYRYHYSWDVSLINTDLKEGLMVKHCLVGHLQRFSSLYENAILSAHPCAHHNSSGGRQTQRAGARDGQNRDGGLERKANDHLCSGDVLVVTL